MKKQETELCVGGNKKLLATRFPRLGHRRRSLGTPSLLGVFHLGSVRANSTLRRRLSAADYLRENG